METLLSPALTTPHRTRRCRMVALRPASAPGTGGGSGVSPTGHRVPTIRSKSVAPRFYPVPLRHRNLRATLPQDVRIFRDGGIVWAMIADGTSATRAGTARRRSGCACSPTGWMRRRRAARVGRQVCARRGIGGTHPSESPVECAQLQRDPAQRGRGTGPTERERETGPANQPKAMDFQSGALTHRPIWASLYNTVAPPKCVDRPPTHTHAPTPTYTHAHTHTHTHDDDTAVVRALFFMGHGRASSHTPHHTTEVLTPWINTYTSICTAPPTCRVKYADCTTATHGSPSLIVQERPGH